MSYAPSPSTPSLQLPDGAWDTHCHVFGPRSVFPFAETRTFTPDDAPKETLFALHRRLGISRSVVVQSGVHGYDHSAVIDVLNDRVGAYRAIALLPLDVADEEIRRLSTFGFCGARFNFMKHLGKATLIEDVIRFASRLADHGWHLVIHFDPSLLSDMLPSLLRSPVPVVIDHMGRIDASLGIEQPHFRTLLQLMDDRRFWIKVSGSERVSRGVSPYRDALTFAQKLVAEFGDRALWGTDWPHPNVEAAPDDGILVDIIADIAPSPSQRLALLVDNPGRLYGV